MGNSFIFINIIVLFISFNVPVKSEDGTDVAQDCPENEEFSACIEALCRGDNCSQIGQQIDCPLEFNESCTEGCVCIAGSLRNDSRSCVPEDQCPVNLECGDDEVVDTCPGECNEFCPVSENDNECSITSPDPESCGAPVCRCGFNSKRDIDTGLCIPVRDCPPFDCSARPYEEYDPCPPLCSDDCSQVTPSGECDFIGRIGIVLQCKPTCRCVPGYGRKDGLCVPLNECPGAKSQECKANEEFSTCVQSLCRGINCSQLNKPIACAIIEAGSCEEGCVCIAGTLRNENGVCVPEDECPGTPECGVNEIFNECGNGCDDDSCPEIIDYEYIDVCIAPAVCLQQCQCAPGFKRDQNGDCIPQDQCPCPCNCLSCGANEMLNQCPSTCNNDSCPVDSSDEDSEEDFCAAVCGTPRCECIDNFKRDQNGDCIPQDQCSGLSCGLNEMVNQCPSICKTDACPTNSSAVDIEELFCPAVCGPPRCECIDNFKRDLNGNCIPQDQCSAGISCGANEMLNQCPNVCNSASDTCPTPSDSSDEGSEEQFCIAVCGPPRCECVNGLKRDQNGGCIPQEQCPGFSCGLNEMLNQCPSICNNDLCPTSLNGEDYGDGDFCADVCGPPRCECINNYKRDQYGNCIPTEECPQICGPYERFNDCPSVCKNDSCPANLTADGDVPCIKICGPPRCECTDNFRRADDGNCIPIQDCHQTQPLQCIAPNEISSCVQSCPPEKTCDNRDIEFDCLQPANSRCENKCICKPGFFRNAIGDCISQNECEQCPGENEFFSCGPECDNVCADLATQNRTNCPIINIVCNRKCYCKDGFARDGSGKCVSVEQCPKNETKCEDPNEEFRKCKKTCPPDSCFSLIARFKCDENPPCNPGCNCKSGFLRINSTSPCIRFCKCPELKNSDIEC